MKSVIFLMTLAFFAISARGQEHKSEVLTSGKITYEEKVKLDIIIEGDVSHMEDMLPKERIAEKILTFTEEATLYEDGNSNPDEEMSSQHSDGGTVRFRMVVSAENKIFTDLKNKKILDQRDFMNRIFLVEKEFPESNWKVTGNQKVIQGFSCTEAISLDTAGKKTVAWFAPSISISSGPAGLCNLPGMILEVDFNDGQRTFTAKSIVAVDRGEIRLQKPKDGKKVTEEEYKTIVAEKMKEMGIEEGGPEGGSRMRIVIKQH